MKVKKSPSNTLKQSAKSAVPLLFRDKYLINTFKEAIILSKCVGNIFLIIDVLHMK